MRRSRRPERNAREDALLRDPLFLAQAMMTGGQGVDWLRVQAPDIFAALTYMGGGTFGGTLRAAQRFVQPGFAPEVTQTALAAQH